MDYETAKLFIGHAILIGGGKFRRRAIIFDVEEPDLDGVIWWQAIDFDEGHFMIQAGIEGQQLLGPAPLEELLTHRNEHLREIGLKRQKRC